MPKITRTMGQFHFEDLEPKRFEDLVRALANDFKDWQSIEATGRGGADDGIDIRAYERVGRSIETESAGDDGGEFADLHPMQGNRWIFQCKREKEIGPKRLGSIADEIDENDPPYGYILAAPVNFSKTSYDRFRTDLIKKGVMEFYLWGRAELEGMLLLPKNDRVLFTFFGVSLVSRRRSRSTEIRASITTKNKLFRVLGEGAGYWPILLRDADDEHYPFTDRYKDFDKHPRWKKFDAIEYHPHGLVVKIARNFGYFDREKGEYDFLDARLEVPDDATQREREAAHKARDLAEDYWDHLPNANRVHYSRDGLVRFNDILVIDEKGIEPHKIPHIFLPFDAANGPFAGFFNYLEVRRGYGEPEVIHVKNLTRVKIFPENLPNVKLGTIHADGAVQVDRETQRYMVSGNDGVREFYDLDDKLSFLKVRDVFRLKDDRKGEPIYFQITHVRATTVGELIKGSDKEYRKAQLEQRFGRDLEDAAKITVYEFKRTYDWKIQRAGGVVSDNAGPSG